MGANILVGCGGTGVETLIRLNELLSEDTYWRSRLASDFYYVLVDTEEAKLNRFQEMLRQQVGEGAKKPVVEIISLSQGYDSLQQPIKRLLVDPFGKDGKTGDSKARERLLEHWWQRSDGELFTAARVKPISDGAGQCPYISYFMTWRYLDKVEDVFRRIIKSIQARTNEANPLANSSFVVAASIAGGTGRGSWQLLAFKMRQLLGKMDREPKPIAFLSDVSVFQNITDRYPRQELAMRINALTGFSELSAWMNNVKPDPNKPPLRFDYRLPAMARAGDFEADVLQAPPNDETAFAPVDAAFLTFAQSGRAFLDDNLDAHEMVGTAIYAALTRMAIRGGVINESNMQYWGVATATFEVSAKTLGRYFESHACMHTLNAMGAADTDLAHERANEFIQTTPTILPTGIKHIAPDENGDLLDRVWYFLIKESTQQWEDLQTILKDEQNPQQAADYIQSISQNAPKAVGNAVKASVTKTDPVAKLMDWARKLYSEEHAGRLAEGDGKTRRRASLATVALFMKEVLGRVDTSLARLKEERFVIAAGEGLLDEIQLNSGRDYWITGQRFNDSEINHIHEHFNKFVFANNFELIKSKVKEQVEAWKTELNRSAAAFDLFLEVCDRVRREYQDDLCAEFDTNGYDPFDELFTNPEEPESSIPDQFDPDRFYRRNVKPVLAREKMTEMLNSGLRDVDSGPIDKLVNANVFDSPLDKVSSSRINDLAQTVRKAIDQSVALDRTFIRQHFSLKPIIADLRDVWQTYFEKRLGRRQAFEDLAARFEAFFGLRPKESNKSIRLGESPADFIARMGASLAARCKPYWQIDTDIDSKAAITLFMPHWGSKELVESKQQIEDTIREAISDPNTRVDIVNEEGELANPFVMLAYSTANVSDLNEVRSLDYWRDNPEVKQMLENCESSEARSLFDPRTNGVGFTDPIYVRNREIAEMRWRPWHTGAEEERKRETLAIDALVYALLEPDEELSVHLKRLTWQLPMLNIEEGKVRFLRSDMLWEQGKARENPQCPWDAEVVLEDSLGKFYSLLDGSGDGQPHAEATAGKAIRDAVLSEADRFWNEIASKVGYGPGTDRRVELLKHQQKLLSDRKKSARDANRVVLEQMIARLSERLT